MIRFGFAAWQYYQAQKWKKAEYLANDWDLRKYQLGKSDTEREEYVIGDADVMRALRFYRPEEVGTDSLDRFPPPDVYIRDIFDAFLSRLVRLEHLAETGLIERRHVKSYLFYYFNIMAGLNKRKSKEFINQLWNFIDGYDYYSVRKLIQQLGYCNLPPKIASLNELPADRRVPS